jgi:hypothetical protein
VRGVILLRTLRSRGATQELSKQLYANGDFRETMYDLFSGEPAGQLVIPTLQDALDRIAELERRVAALEEQ